MQRLPIGVLILPLPIPACAVPERPQRPEEASPPQETVIGLEGQARVVAPKTDTRIMTMEELRACAQDKLDLNTRVDQLSTEGLSLALEGAELEADQAQVDASRRSVDVKSARTVNSFLSRVQKGRKRMDSYRARVEGFNTAVVALTRRQDFFNSTCARLNFRAGDVESLTAEQRQAMQADSLVLVAPAALKTNSLAGNELRWCATTLLATDPLEQGLKTEKAALTAAGEKLEANAKRLSAEFSRVDRTSRGQVDRYNSDLARTKQAATDFHARVDSWREAAAWYENMIRRFNVNCAERVYEVTDLEGFSDAEQRTLKAHTKKKP
jgi:hypothetical protein